VVQFGVVDAKADSGVIPKRRVFIGGARACPEQAKRAEGNLPRKQHFQVKLTFISCQ